MIKWIKNWIMDHLRTIYIVEYKNEDGQVWCLNASNNQKYAEAICEMYAHLNPTIRRDLVYVRSKYATYEPNPKEFFIQNN